MVRMVRAAFALCTIVRPLLACAPTDNPTECAALLSIYESMMGKFWRKNSGWTSSATMCSWYGVGCLDGHVTSIALSDNLVKGVVSPSIADLTHLKYFDLSNNHISGTLPSELGHAMTVESLLLQQNRISGTISDEFGYLLTLVTLDLSSNMLTGGIHAVSKLHSIQTIRLQKNAFQSVDLSDFGRLSLLQELNLENNGLPGVLPSEWPNGGRMRSLNVAKNALSGSIPPHMLDHMPLLESFMANENELEGTIPWAEWAECNLTSVHTLELQSNALTGEISEEIGAALPSLTVLRLHANELSGTMPAALADLANLLELRADGNSLGPIVESTALLCSLWFPPRGVEYCDLSGQLGNALSCGALPPPECLAAHCSVAACAPRPPGPTLPNASNTPGGGAGGDGLFASLASEALFVMLMSCGTVGIGVAALLAVLCVVVVVLGPTKIGQCVRGCRFGQPRTRGGGKGGGGGGGTEMSGLERDTSGADAPHAGHLAARLLRYIHEEMLTSPTGLRGGRRRARRGRTELASPDIFSSDDDPRPFSEGEVEDDDESSQLLTDSSVSTAALGMMDCAYAVSEESTSTDE